MQDFIVCRGLPACGKTTWARDYISKNENYVRINRDDLRRMRGKYWLPEQEELITAWERDCIENALNKGYSIILDATNLNPKYFESLFDEYANRPNILFYTQDFFDVSLEECIKRDFNRIDAVGEKVIKEMYDRYFSSSSKKSYVTQKGHVKSLFEKYKPIEVIKQNINLPRTIICDLDGTLCIHDGRGPFEYSKCDTDLVNTPILNIIKDWRTSQRDFNRKVIFFSGREDMCKEKTIEWLEKNCGWAIYECGEDEWSGEKIENIYFELYMRKSGDYRKDSIIKKEMFDEYIKDKYYVDYILDDRDQVVKMWRQLGLTCLQVAEGNF